MDRGSARGAYGNSEHHYAADLWQLVPPSSVVILDKLYFSAAVLVPLARDAQDRHWLLRAKSDAKWRVVRRLGAGDDLVEFTVWRGARAKAPSLPETYLARAIRYQHPGFRVQTLLTSMLDETAFPAAEIRDLYHERREIELGYDELKTHMLERQEAIRSRTPDGVRQQLWGILIAYNLVRLEMERIADEAGVEPTRISFITALRYIRDEWDWSAISRTPGAIPGHLRRMRANILRFLLRPRRADRRYPRAVKIKMSPYTLNRRHRRGKPAK